MTASFQIISNSLLTDNPIRLLTSLPHVTHVRRLTRYVINSKGIWNTLSRIFFGLKYSNKILYFQTGRGNLQLTQDANRGGVGGGGGRYYFPTHTTFWIRREEFAGNSHWIWLVSNTKSFAWNTSALGQYAKILFNGFSYCEAVVYSFSRNRPWKPIGLWDVKNSTLSRQTAQMAVRLSALRTSSDLLPRNIHFLLLELTSVTGWVHPRALYGMTDYVAWTFIHYKRAANTWPSGWYNITLSSMLQTASMCVCVCVC
jgi:hypothetical protein